MPYIRTEQRLGASSNPSDPGELNYAFTVLINKYLDHEGLSYLSCNDIMGALEGAKMEFYRRVVVPYEEKKLKENGDIYQFEGSVNI